MRNFPLAFFLPILLGILCACDKNELNTSPDFRLDFSTDTLSFDTLFTEVASTTLQFKVYNRSSRSVQIQRIGLASPDGSSPFRLNINGTVSNILENIELHARDSLYIFVEVDLDFQDNNLPLLVKDSIIFELNGIQQDVKLRAWGQDVHLIEGARLTSQTWTAKRPYLLSDTVWVDSLQTLMLEPGARIYFQKGSGLHVKGTLRAFGSFEEPIKFSGSRLEEDYQGIPGQWEGLFFYPGSKNNALGNVVLMNAKQGIRVRSNGEMDLPTLEISWARLSNFLSTGIWAQQAKIIANNLLIANCGQQALWLEQGGNYEFYHATIANFWRHSYREAASVEIQTETGSKNFTLEKAFFSNCIIYGNNRTELIAGPDVNSSSLNFMNCLIRLEENGTSTEEDYFYNCLFNTDPMFLNMEENDFHLMESSPVRDKGNVQVGGQFPLDLDGNNRTLDTAPDMGCFEHIME